MGRGEVVDIAALAPYVAGFSDDGSGVSDAGIMEEAMWRVKECDSIIAAHCEVDDLVRGGVIHDGEFARRNGIPVHHDRCICYRYCNDRTCRFRTSFSFP